MITVFTLDGTDKVFIALQLFISIDVNFKQSSISNVSRNGYY